MHQYLIEMFGISLLLTLLIELIVAGLLGLAWGKKLLPVVLVNVLTNPVVVFLCWVWRIYVPAVNSLWIQLPLEVVVIQVEFSIYKSMARSGWGCKNPWKLSVVANGTSWLMGVLISLLR